MDILLCRFLFALEEVICLSVTPYFIACSDYTSSPSMSNLPSCSSPTFRLTFCVALLFDKLLIVLAALWLNEVSVYLAVVNNDG